MAKPAAFTPQWNLMRSFNKCISSDIFSLMSLQQISSPRCLLFRMTRFLIYYNMLPSYTLKLKGGAFQSFRCHLRA